jgi:hypothetical protein
MSVKHMVLGKTSCTENSSKEAEGVQGGPGASVDRQGHLPSWASSSPWKQLHRRSSTACQEGRAISPTDTKYPLFQL